MSRLACSDNGVLATNSDQEKEEARPPAPPGVEPTTRRSSPNVSLSKNVAGRRS